MKMTTVFAVLIAFAGTGLAFPADPFPREKDAYTLESGEATIREGDFALGGVTFNADYGYIAVPEDYDDPGRLIHLPFIRVRSTSPAPAEPIFKLAGGPGGPNIFTADRITNPRPLIALLDNHDVVMVGYRGIDFLEKDEVSFRQVGRALRTRGNPFEEAQMQKVQKAIRDTMAAIEARGIDPDEYSVLNVIEDHESVRRELGYDRINLYSCSYGTRIAYLYGRVHPRSLHRSVMIGANPPGGFVWEPDQIQAVLERYRALWRADPAASARTPDIVETMERVLDTLPRTWMGVRIDPEKVKGVTQFFLFNQGGAAAIFDAYVAADRGDYSGLAYLSIGYNLALPSLFNFDHITKAYGLDFDPDRDYRQLRDTPYVLDSALSTLDWTPGQAGAIDIAMAEERYRRLERSDANALILNGTLDMSTSIENARRLHAAMPNSTLIELPNFGHCTDVQHLQPEVFDRLIVRYYAIGEADVDAFAPQAVSFEPGKTFQRRAKTIVWGVAGTATVVLGGIAAAVFGLVR